MCEDRLLGDVLGGIGSVVHHEELNVLDVVDEESLEAGRHHIAGFAVRAKANLPVRISQRPQCHEQL